MAITLENVAATTEPFKLDVGHHVLALTGEFNSAVVTLERRSPDAHPSDGDHLARPDGGLPISLWHRVAGPFDKPDGAEFTVAPNGVGPHRLRVDGGSTPAAIGVVIATPPTGEEN